MTCLPNAAAIQAAANDIHAPGIIGSHAKGDHHCTGSLRLCLRWKKYPHIKGFVYFFPLWGGTVVLADVAGLPTSEAACRVKIFAFHIHEGSSCEENAEGDFPLTGSHLNPKDCPHPEHAGDLPPLFENDGYALSMFYTNRFVPEEIIGRTVVIHENPDDFKTQPSGDSGSKIACGEIKSNLED